MTCLLNDYSYVGTLFTLKERVTNPLIESADRYKHWHGAYADRLVYEATQFFNDDNFNRDVVDLIVQTTADALNLKLNIYMRNPAGNIQLLVQESVQPKMAVHLKFSTASVCKPSYTGANHHDAVIIISRDIEGKSTGSKE